MTDIQRTVNLIRGLGVRRYYLIHMDLLSKDRILMKEAMGYIEFMTFYKKIKGDNPDVGIFRVNASCFEKGSLPAGTRCAAGVRKLAMMPDGSVLPCNLFQDFEEFNLGNIFHDDLSSIWRNPKLNVFRKSEENGCADLTCGNRDSCTGGCPAHGLYHKGHPEGRDMRCMPVNL
jgi:radical SAM protein with 4Fe4S-binding SPASM domain